MKKSWIDTRSGKITSKNKTWVVDFEGDGLKPTKLHVGSFGDPNTGKIFSTTSYDNMKKALLEAQIIIVHNGKRFDVPVLERILGIKIKCKVIDSLALSWYLYPERKRHGLEEWGEHYGVPKPIINDWENLPIEQYIKRCEEDVKINILLWKDQLQYLMELYGTQKRVWEFLDYISFKMDCATLQEKSGWKVDLPYIEKAINELQSLKDNKLAELIDAMPLVPIKKVRSKPKRFLNAKGDYTKLGLDWIEFLQDQGLPPDYSEDVEFTSGYKPGNPDSHQQIKDWLNDLGWQPQTFEYKKDKETGELKSIPQINLDFGKGICPSIKNLFEIEPKLELLDGLSVISHRLSVLKGIKKGVDENGYTKAQITGFTNTLRVKHTTVVNLPKVDKPYGEFVRGSLIADEGHILCGSDMSSLEDRIKQHNLYKYDPKYVDSMDKPDFDPHLEIAVLGGLMSEDEKEFYKWYQKKNS